MLLLVLHQIHLATHFLQKHLLLFKRQRLSAETTKSHHKVVTEQWFKIKWNQEPHQVSKESLHHLHNSLNRYLICSHKTNRCKCLLPCSSNNSNNLSFSSNLHQWCLPNLKWVCHLQDSNNGPSLSKLYNNQWSWSSNRLILPIQDNSKCNSHHRCSSLLHNRHRQEMTHERQKWKKNI